jgi:hypothetical protein
MQEKAGQMKRQAPVMRLCQQQASGTARGITLYADATM